ncbi:aminopeptidase N-like [Glandiceps talaboti]
MNYRDDLDNLKAEGKKLPKGFFVTQKTAVLIAVLFIVIIICVSLLFFFIPNPLYQESSPPDSDCSPQLPAEPGPQPTVEPREDFDERLPGIGLYPEHYDITLTIFLDEEDDDDNDRFTFTGSETILLRCDKASDIIKMNSRFLEVNVETDYIEVTESDSGDDIGVYKAYLDDVHELLVIELSDTLQVGKTYNVNIKEFGAEIGDADFDQYGMYYQSYDINGETRWMCNTKFTPNYAREVFPCYDEPHFRATFDLHLIHRDKRWALSNMPVKETTTMANDWIMTSFDTTPNMVTYLLVLVLADFPSIQLTTKYGYEFNVWAREDLIYSANYSLYAGSETLTYFEELLETPYGLPKMDFVAIPDYAAGATEFWGCVLYRESRLLYDEDIHTPYDQQRVAAIIGHELAHMWFGNYLTCDWWDEIWLNEGFASFYEYLPMTYLHPEWKVADQFMNLDLESAFRVDGSSSTAVPVIRPASGWRDEITGVFDTTAYSGGACVCRSLRSFLSEDVLHNGIVNYVQNNLFSAVVSDELWAELTLADAGHGDTNVKLVMDTWTLQHGHPVVTVNRTSTEFAVLTQEHFMIDPNDEATDKYDNLGYLWYVPITFTYASDVSFDDPLKHFQWLNKVETGELDLQGVNENDWVVVNINQMGFYRVNYDEENWHRLSDALKTDYTLFPAQTRTALLDDCFKISQAMYTDQVNCLRLSEYMHSETEYPTWELMIDNLPFTYRALMRTAEFGQLEFYWRQQITPIYESLGWDFSQGNSLEYRLRQEAINTACAYGNENCVGNATQLYAEWMETGTNSVPVEVKSVVYCTAIKHGGFKEWNFAHDESETNSDEAANLRSAMGCSKESWILERYIEEFFDDYYAFSVIAEVREKSAVGYSVAWNYVISNYDRLNATFGDDAYSAVWGFSTWMNTEFDLNQLQAFASMHPEMPSTAASNFYYSKLQVETNIKWMDKNRASIRQWLDDTVQPS